MLCSFILTCWQMLCFSFEMVVYGILLLLGEPQKNPTYSIVYHSHCLPSLLLRHVFFFEMPPNTISITSSSHKSTSWLRVESAKGSAFPSHELYVWGARSRNYHGTLHTIITVFADGPLRLSLLASRVCRLDVALAPPTGSQLIGQTSEFGADERIKKREHTRS